MSRHTTIYRELTRPNPEVRNFNMGGSNSAPIQRLVDSWTQWQHFTAENLYNIFHDITHAEWTVRDSLYGAPTSWDSEVHDEDELEHNIMAKYIIPPVNAALAAASRHTGRTLNLHLGRSGKTSSAIIPDNRLHADWALCSEGYMDLSRPHRPKYISLLPGDTKISSKWPSSYFPEKKSAWSDPVDQVVGYTFNAPSRYGFIVTDDELVVLRVRTEPSGHGLAATRPHRQLPSGPGIPAPGTASHARQLSNVTTATAETILSDGIHNMSLADSSGSYRPTPVIADAPVEFCSIPWSNNAESSGSRKGKGREEPILTVRLALFYLCWMAASSNVPQESYPGLDTYWWSEETGTFIHNTITKPYKRSGLPRRSEHFNPLASDRGPVFVDSEDGNTSYLTRASVRTLNIVEREGGRLFYVYMTAEGEERLVTREMQVLDVERNVLGHFVNLVWQEGPYVQSSSGDRKHSSNTSGSWGSSQKKRR